MENQDEELLKDNLLKNLQKKGCCIKKINNIYEKITSFKKKILLSLYVSMYKYYCIILICITSKRKILLICIISRDKILLQVFVL
mgnify:CR=1 FL=1